MCLIATLLQFSPIQPLTSAIENEFFPGDWHAEMMRLAYDSSETLFLASYHGVASCTLVMRNFSYLPGKVWVNSSDANQKRTRLNTKAEPMNRDILLRALAVIVLLLAGVAVAETESSDHFVRFVW